MAAAVAATESSAWRGRSSPGGWTAIGTLRSYLSDREKQVQIIPGHTVVLAGPSGITPVSVSNGLDVPVQVEVRALLPADSQISIGKFNPLVVIPPGQIYVVRMPVRSATLGSTLMQLQLATRNGTPLGTTAVPQRRVDQVRARIAHRDRRSAGRALAIVPGAVGTPEVA